MRKSLDRYEIPIKKMYDLIMKIALVLQGGGSRGIFTSAIIDKLLEENIKIDKVFGVSAGALNAMNFISKQKGRAKEATLLTFKSKEFTSLKNVIVKRTFVDFNYYFNDLNKILPFDEKTFKENPTDLCVIATSLTTGKACYFLKSETQNLNEAIKASASIPFVAKPVKINSDLYLDGGDSDPIPLQKALDEGFDKIIVVLTRPYGFRKSKTIKKQKQKLIEVVFKKYQNYVYALKNSHQNYNTCVEEVEKENEKVFVFAPSEEINLKHLEKNKEKLNYYYDLGKKVFEGNKKKLADFLS